LTGLSPSNSLTAQLIDCGEQEAVLVGIWEVRPFACGRQGGLRVEQRSQDQMMVDKDIHEGD
jgi:hypothetical protein